LLYAPNSHFLYVGGILPFRFPSSNPSIFKFPFLSFMLQRNIRVYPSFPTPPSFIYSFIHSCFPSFLVSLLYLFAVVFEGYCCTWSHLIKHTHTHTRTLVVTSLDEGSVCRRYLYLKTHNIHKKQTTMPPAGFEPATARDPRLRPCGHWDRLHYILF